MKIWTAMAYVLARYEVRRAVSSRWAADRNSCADGLSPELIPSLRLEGPRSLKERVLAEIDQDGFIFAVDDRDRKLFHGRESMVPRKHHRIQIVSSDGAIRLRKTFLARDKGVLGWLRNHLQWELYLESAALLRLRGVDGVPTIRLMNANKGFIEMDYISGVNLRHAFNADALSIDCDKAPKNLDEFFSGVSELLPELLARVISRGVIPRDLHAANLILAFPSRRLYLVDFNLVHLAPVPGWRSEVRRLKRGMDTPLVGITGSPPLRKSLLN